MQTCQRIRVPDTIEGIAAIARLVAQLDDVIAEQSGILARVARDLERRDRGSVLLYDTRLALRTADAVRERAQSIVRRVVG